MRRYERDKLASFNERVKLLAGFLNALGLGLIGFAVLRPLTEVPFSTAGLSISWGTLGLVMHGIALYILRYLRRETADALV